MKYLMKFLKPYRKESILGPLFKLLEACFELLVPLVVARIIDVGIENGDRRVILTNSLILIALGIIGLASSITAQYYAAKASVGFVKHIRHALFSHIGELSYADLDRAGASTMITRMTSDTNQIQSGMNLALRLLLRSPFVVFGAMVVAFTIDVKGALVFAVAIPVLLAVVFAIMLVCLPLYQKVQRHLDGITGATRENLTGVRVIRAFCREEEEKDAFHEKNEALTTLQNRVGRISNLLNPLSYALINLAIVVLIYVGAIRVNQGTLSKGEVVALYNLMSQILVELIKFANLIINITKAVACGNRVEALLRLPCSMPISEHPVSEIPAPGEDDEVVRFDHVELCYPGAGEPSLSDITFTARRGETIGVIGGTGSGKTSLVNLIPRFYDATGGEILVDGIPVREWSPTSLRARIGIVPQKAVLFKGTIRENLAWGKQDATEQEMEEALSLAQASEIVHGKPGGLDAEVEQNGRNFSGGQRQRLTIARALIRRPEILILDDSSSALDYATDAALRHAIRSLSYHPVVFLVSQRATSLRYADRILVLDDGALVGVGNHDELLKNCVVYREIYESQFKKDQASI